MAFLCVRMFKRESPRVYALESNWVCAHLPVKESLWMYACKGRWVFVQEGDLRVDACESFWVCSRGRAGNFMSVKAVVCVCVCVFQREDRRMDACESLPVYESLWECMIQRVPKNLCVRIFLSVYAWSTREHKNKCGWTSLSLCVKERAQEYMRVKAFECVRSRVRAQEYVLVKAFVCVPVPKRKPKNVCVQVFKCVCSRENPSCYNSPSGAASRCVISVAS